MLSIPWTCLHSWPCPCLAHLYSISWASSLNSFQPHNSPNSLNPSPPLFSYTDTFQCLRCFSLHPLPLYQANSSSSSRSQLEATSLGLPSLTCQSTSGSPWYSQSSSLLLTSHSSDWLVTCVIFCLKKASFPYYVSSSTNGKDWVDIVHCCTPQWLAHKRC